MISRFLYLFLLQTSILLEALALCWMCLTSARRRLPTAFTMIYKAPLTSLSLQKDTDDIYGTTPHNSFALPTFYGESTNFYLRIPFRILVSH